MSERRSLKSGLSFGALSFTFTVGIAVLSSIVSARLYGVTVMGQFALVAAPAAVIWFLSNAGEQTAAVRMFVDLPHRHPKATGIWVVVYGFSMLLTSTVGLLVLVGAYFMLHGPLGHPGLFPATAVNTLGCILVSNTAWNLETPLTAFMAGRELFWIRLAQPSIFVLIAVVLSFTDLGVWSLVAATVGSWGFSLLHRAYSVRPFLSLRPTRSEVRAAMRELPEMLSFGIRIVPGNLSTGISYEIGIWILGLHQSVDVVGAYSRAWSVIRRFTEANWRVSEMLFPSLVSRRRQGDDEGFSRAALDTMRYVLIIALLPAAIGGGSAYSVMSIFGPGFQRGAGTFAILLLAPPLSMTQTVQEAVLLARDRPTLVSVASFSQLIVTLVGTFALTPSLGIDGPAIAVVGGFAIAVVLQLFFLRGAFGDRRRQFFPASHLIGALAAYGVTFAATRALANAIDVIPLAILAEGAIGIAVYLAVLLVIARPQERDRARLRGLIERLPSWRHPAAAADS
ncbi:MAG: polysaccharide biosynthesis C-terminal domain-containing protein [Actinobacteria bacterium]|nr:polysaccharide biosynthesis C-terminal domain-containing protein [Actinomycetota bacterium]